jgi:Ca-activated chloride channel homolog
MFMLGVSFAIDTTALGIALPLGALAYFVWRWRQTFSLPHLKFSNLRGFEGPSQGWRRALASTPQRLAWLSLLFFALAFLDPHLFIDRKKEQKGKHLPYGQLGEVSPSEGIAIYFVLDQSGSMMEKVSAVTPDGFRKMMSKIDLLKQVTTQFIQGDPKLKLEGRPNDMIGLVAFARGATILSPLTLDHQAILDQLSHFDVVHQRDQDGTAIGYAIFKTVNLIAATRHYAQELIEKGEPAYTIKNSVIILVTDGLQDPNPLDKGKRLRNMDIPEAAEYAKRQGIRLYIVNVEPKLATDEFAPYRRVMQRAAELTGGKFYMMNGSNNLEQIYAEINQLEKSALPEQAKAEVRKDLRPDLYRRISFYPYLIALGLLCLMMAIVLDATVLRKVP